MQKRARFRSVKACSAMIEPWTASAPDEPETGNEVNVKKFQFSLETVLNYKDQVLENLRAEHAMILAQVRQQQELIRQKEQAYRALGDEYAQKAETGMSIIDALGYDGCFRSMERELRKERLHLVELNKQEEAKRSEVVKARQETAALEKLRENKQKDYNKAVQKEEEQLIDEFVSMQRVMAQGDT